MTRERFIALVFMKAVRVSPTYMECGRTFILVIPRADNAEDRAIPRLPTEFPPRADLPRPHHLRESVPDFEEVPGEREAARQLDRVPVKTLLSWG